MGTTIEGRRVPSTRWRVVALVVGAAVVAGASAGSGELDRAGGAVRVIVRGDPGGVDQVAAAVVAVGGDVERTLTILDGVVADVDPGRLSDLAAAPAVRAVTPDATITLHSVDPALGYDPAADVGSLNGISRIVGAQAAWRAGYTGRGVDVALIDTGVAPVEGLTSGNVLTGPDLSFDSQEPSLTNNDAFGHGTHMASLIVGRDRAGSPSSYLDPGRFTGIAPDARLISVKVGASDGAADVSQVIAGIEWVVQHARDPGFNIRVLSLSFGTDASQLPGLDPLAYAAEVAWRNGIVVVASGGNDGNDSPILANPARDPLVLAVGATDPVGTVATGDDVVPPFATRGDYARHVDIVAPGVHVLGLGVPGSAIDEANPAARVGSRFFRGSGTSQAAAITAGAAAIVLQRFPTASPEQVKRLLMSTATPLRAVSAVYRGNGSIDVGRAVASRIDLRAVVPTSLFGTGRGSLEGSRGSAHVADEGVELAGEIDIFGAPWDGARWSATALARTSWQGSAWNGNVWTGTGWTGTAWTGASWAGTTWSGRTWSGRTWSGRTWSGRTWSGGAWEGGDWSGRTWSGRTWSEQSWTGTSWATAAWS